MELNTAYKRIVNQAGDSICDLKLQFQQNQKPLPYTYPCNNYLAKLLSLRWIKNSLQIIFDNNYQVQLEDIIIKGQTITKPSYPTLYAIIEECIIILNANITPTIVVTNKLKGINALSVGTDKKPMILLSPKCTTLLTERELKFIIGHELGHILQGNILCHTVSGLLNNLQKTSDVLGTILADMIEIPLNAWCRSSEYTADRAGLKCCEDIEIANGIICKAYNIKEYYDRKLTEKESLLELYHNHPNSLNRVTELVKYAKTIAL